VKVTKIVITGGPCAGKTTALKYVKDAFEKLGYAVLTVSETASELISGGVAPWTCGTPEDFQRCRLKLQLERERIYEAAAITMKCENVLIVCDRGALDTRCYTDDDQFSSALSAVGKSEWELRDSYDAVFHLVTSAKGAKASYATGEGTGRYEMPEESARLDDRLISAWCGHPHLRVIGCEERFEDKAAHLVREISSFLGVPKPLEIERKFLIEYPDIKALESDPFCRKVEIEQVYIKTASGGARIRRRGADGDFIYFYTEKRDISDVCRIETESRITEKEYFEYMKSADPERRPLRKDRYCLVYGERYFEIDVYPFWRDRAIMEIELENEHESFLLPDHIKVLKDVTGEQEYKNYNIAKNV